jgi:dUTP pyrophosphatase
MKKKTINIPTFLETQSELPTYSSEDAAGADLKAAITKEIILLSGMSVLVPTGLRFAIPVGYEIQIRPRSGLALKHGVTVLNTPGTIDADYRGEVGVILINHGKESFIVTPGMRIAQLVVAEVIQANFLASKELAVTIRGNGGFGHTGTH